MAMKSSANGVELENIKKKKKGGGGCLFTGVFIPVKLLNETSI